MSAIKPTNYSERVTEYRLSQGLSQSELAKQMGVTQQLVSWVESASGKKAPSIDFAKAFQRVSGIDLLNDDYQPLNTIRSLRAKRSDVPPVEDVAGEIAKIKSAYNSLVEYCKTLKSRLDVVEKEVVYLKGGVMSGGELNRLD